MKRALAISFIIAAFFMTPFAGAATDPPDDITLRSWVQEMKKAPRGPFTRLRWFCNDGTILPPKEYACKDHGGGVQHGEWTERVKLMRNNELLHCQYLCGYRSGSVTEESPTPGNHKTNDPGTISD